MHNAEAEERGAARARASCSYRRRMRETDSMSDWIGVLIAGLAFALSATGTR